MVPWQDGTLPHISTSVYMNVGTYSMYSLNSNVNSSLDFDKRRDPKQQAKWLREFLDWLLTPTIAKFILPDDCRKARLVQPVARASPLHFPEWKLKLWKQSFA